MTLLRLCFFLGLASFPLSRTALADGASPESDRSGAIRVSVVIDMTDQGKKIARPTSERPARYLPIYIGYKEIGGRLVNFRGPPPPTDGIERLLVNALDEQGYLRATNRFPPSLVLVFRWGSLAPIAGQMTKLDCTNFPPTPVTMNTIVNQEEMLTYAVGSNWKAWTASIDPTGFPRSFDPATQELFDSIHQGNDPLGNGRGARYYLLASALDFPAFTHHKEVLLWRAHVSTEYWGHPLDEVLPTLIAASAPMFGRETGRPRMISAPVIPVGHVTVGTPEVKAFPSAP